MKKEEKKYFIYSYEFENKYVYVGLTIDVFTRHKSHCNDQKDTLYRFCVDNHYEISFPIILETSLSSLEAQAKEKDWIYYYSSNGYNIINKAKTGVYYSSLGNYNERDMEKKHSGCLSNINEALLSSKLSFEECYNIAKQYKLKREFRLGDMAAYSYSHKMGWFKLYDWLKNDKRVCLLNSDNITKEEYIKYAKLCGTKTEFSILYRPFYLWGLKNGLNDEVFKKELKTKYRKPKNFIELSYSEVETIIKNFSCKTDLYRRDHALYEYCRNNGWLNELKFNNNKIVDKKYRYMKNRESLNINEINIDCLSEINGFPGYLIDTKACKVYRKLKKKIHELSYTSDGIGMRFYLLYTKNGNSRVYPYHKLVRLSFKGNDVYNCVEYLDGDYTNININNLKFFYFDTSNIRQVHRYYNTYINNNGDIYDKLNETLNYNIKIIDGEKYIGQYSISNLVYSFFVHRIDENEKVIHIDGDLNNNNYSNLMVEKNEYELFIDDKENTYEIYLSDYRRKKILIGHIWSDVVVKEIKKKIEKYLKEYSDVDSWFETFMNKEYQEYLKIDKKYYTDKIRTESSGCYWFEPRKCWKSKIYVEGKEWSLGYFDTFEQGKIMYEIAAIMVKHNMFEKWYRKKKDEKAIIESFNS